MSSNRFLLIVGILMFITSIASFGYVLYRVHSMNTYWGNSMLGQGYWLHPKNQNVEDVSHIEYYSGRIVEAQQVGENNIELAVYRTTLDRVDILNLNINNLRAGVIANDELIFLENDTEKIVAALIKDRSVILQRRSSLKNDLTFDVLNIVND